MLVMWLVVGGAAHASERTYTLRAGPYRLGDFATNYPREAVRTPARGGWVTRMHARLVDRRGRPVTLRDVMLHHVVFHNLSIRRPPGPCVLRQGEAFYGTGEENQALALPPGYGYRLRRGDRWYMRAMLMSHRLAARNVYVEYRVTVASGSRRAVRPFWIRASGCTGPPSYRIQGGGPPGSTHDQVEHWRVPYDARIVAAGGHLHGGALDLRMTQPRCRGRRLFHQRPAYGAPDHLVYRVRPVLHEIGPIATSWFSSRTGIPIRRGEVLDLHGLYDAERPHPGVMAISHVYLARDARRRADCPPLPADLRQANPPAGSRSLPPWVLVPLSTLDARGRPVILAEPPDATTDLTGGGTVAVLDSRFAPSKLTTRPGDTIRWRWRGRLPHNIRLANGPRSVGTRTQVRGTIEHRLSVPGRYQLFCSRHPMRMHAQVVVQP